MADEEHPKSVKSDKRHSISSAPAEDVRSHRASAIDFPAEQEVESGPKARASEPAIVSSPKGASEKRPSIKNPNEEPEVLESKSPGVQSRAEAPKSPAVQSIKLEAPKSPGAQSVKTVPKLSDPKSQPKSPAAQSSKSQPKSPGRQSAASIPKSSGSISAAPKSSGRQSVPPKSPGGQSVTTQAKSPGKQSVAGQPTSQRRQSVTTQPKSPGKPSTTVLPTSPGAQSVASPMHPGTIPAAVDSSLPVTPAAAPTGEEAEPPVVPIYSTPTTVEPTMMPSAVSTAMLPPESPGKQSVAMPPKSPGKRSAAATPKSPAATSTPVATPEHLQTISLESESQQQIPPDAALVPPSEPAIAASVVEPSEAGAKLLAPAVEGVEMHKEAEPTGEETEDVQEFDKAELVVKDVLYEITGLESSSFQGYMGSLGDFLCNGCKTAVYALWKTPCNHQFCEKCKVAGVIEDTFTCAVEGTHINLTELVEVTSDLDKLQEAEVFCLNKEQGCREKFPIKQIKEHLDDCYYTFFPCPQNCGETRIRKELGKHLTEECERRVYLCEMCETDVQETLKTEHDEMCEKKPPATNCDFCGMGPIERADMERHYQECVQKPRPCGMSTIGCSFVGTKEEIDCHENFDNHRELITMFIQEQKETVMNLEQEKNETKLQLSEALGKLQNIDLINRYLAVKVGILEEVPYVQKEMEEENKFLKQKVEELLKKQLTHEEQISRMTEYCAGRPFEWIINDYSQKKEIEMTEGGRQASPPFYISYSGYRVRLLAYLNGNGDGKGTHLSIYYCVMKGANDAVLDWPFQQKVALRLVDRKFGTPLLKKVVEPKSFTLGDDSFQRPVFEENVGRGYPKFISHEDLEAIDSRYLLKDSIIITAEFEPAEITE